MTTRSLLPLLLALTTSGCGGLMSFPDEAPDWPLVKTKGPKPTLLVRSHAHLEEESVLVGDRRAVLRRIHAIPLESGLFSVVAHQASFEDSELKTDYTIDLDISVDVEAEWYSFLGLIPGVPLVGTKVYTVSSTVWDADRKSLGSYQATGRATFAGGLIFLPVNLAFSFLPLDLGMDMASWDLKSELLFEDLTKQVLAEAHRKLRFRAPRRRALRAGAPKASRKR